MLRLHGSYQLDQLSKRQVGMKIMKVLLREHNEFTQYDRDDVVVIISNLHCCSWLHAAATIIFIFTFLLSHFLSSFVCTVRKWISGGSCCSYFQNAPITS